MRSFSWKLPKYFHVSKQIKTAAIFCYLDFFWFLATLMWPLNRFHVCNSFLCSALVIGHLCRALVVHWMASWWTITSPVMLKLFQSILVLKNLITFGSISPPGTTTQGGLQLRNPRCDATSRRQGNKSSLLWKIKEVSSWYESVSRCCSQVSESKCRLWSSLQWTAQGRVRL